ncbi:MAG: TfoX/Sxy family protein [Burkholderiales bacterium]
MKSTRDFADYAVELLGTVGHVAARRMFGGYGLYCDGVMFALIADDVLYFKADDATRPAFERANSEPFVYAARGRRTTMAYWRAPDEAMESREVAAPWARIALAAALRARYAKRKPRTRVQSARPKRRPRE